MGNNNKKNKQKNERDRRLPSSLLNYPMWSALPYSSFHCCSDGAAAAAWLMALPLLDPGHTFRPIIRATPPAGLTEALHDFGIPKGLEN
jgi:hypothetical protein